MSWRRDISDLFWFLVVCVVVATVGFICITSWKIITYEPWNDNKVLYQFLKEKVEICHEKLGAYGESVDFNNLEISIESLTICTEKLGAYGEPVELPIKFE